ncbi:MULTISPECIES: hypothetical protein [unclassified Nostoc]|nr:MULTISPECIES: hypothetical protein [unclassified Nostoc]MDM9585111.1 hypothetical protein [Nostoc sp. GT001]MDZ7949153.1 hypothetical protein [Nostoc sp. EfeVER01]MDZ7995550.1 hypothetical protein [Nostoc sp. EspVER01]
MAKVSYYYLAFSTPTSTDSATFTLSDAERLAAWVRQHPLSGFEH